MSEPARRGRKYGSDYARAWARGLRFGDVRTKATLNAACNYVDEDGTCWPSIGTLADDTDQSEDSVRRRLVVLENLGVIARFPRWRDERGKVNYDGNGKRTTDEIRLLFTISQDDIDAKNPVKSGGDDEGEAASFSPSQQQGLNPVSPRSEPGLSPSQQPGGRSHCGDPHDDPSLDPILPQSPFLAGDGQQQETGIDDWIEEFLRCYPLPSNRPDQLQTLAQALTLQEREKAITAAKGLREFLKGNKLRFNPLSPEKFLARTASWDQWLRHAPKPPPPRVFLPEGSEGYRAECVLSTIVDRWNVAPAEHVGFDGKGIIRTAEFRDPGGRALVEFAASDGSVDTSGWIIAEQGSKQFAAWAERIFKWTGYRPDGYRIGLGYLTDFEWPKGTFKKIEAREIGLRVPRRWPPRVDGTWPVEDDENHLAKTG